MRSDAHIGIAGAGLLGRLLAWRLLEKGCRVSLYEAGSLTQSTAAAHTAAGMVAPISEAIDTEPLMYQMGAAALDIWPQWLAELAPVDTVSYNAEGSLVVAHPKDQSLLTQYIRDMQQMLPDEAQGTILNQHSLRELEPDIGEHFRQGLWLTQEAHIDNRSLLTVLLKRLQKLGCQCFENMAVSVSGNKVTVNNNTVEEFDLVLDCRGVGANAKGGEDAKTTKGDQWQEVRGVRGEVLRVTSDEVRLQRPVRLLHPRYQLYVVPAADQQFIIGATQIESEDSSPVSVQSCMELCSALYTINSAFAEARIIELTSNLRPALKDNRPQVLWDKGLARINGLYRHGYLLAPVVVSHVTSVLFDVKNSLSQPFTGVLDHFIYGSNYADCLH